MSSCRRVCEVDKADVELCRVIAVVTHPLEGLLTALGGAIVDEQERVLVFFVYAIVDCVRSGYVVVG